MRVVVLVPDSDVVLTKLGDKAVVSVDALGGRSFTGTLARIARAEDAERMMRVEIDLPNPDDVLCDGMYGKAIITLGQDAKSLAVPAACVVEHSGRSGGVVFVVRDGDRPAHRGQAGRRQRLRTPRSAPESARTTRSSFPSGTPLEDGMRVAVVEVPHVLIAPRRVIPGCVRTPL